MNVILVAIRRPFDGTGSSEPRNSFAVKRATANGNQRPIVVKITRSTTRKYKSNVLGVGTPLTKRRGESNGLIITFAHQNVTASGRQKTSSGQTTTNGLVAVENMALVGTLKSAERSANGTGLNAKIVASHKADPSNYTAVGSMSTTS